MRGTKKEKKVRGTKKRRKNSERERGTKNEVRRKEVKSCTLCSSTSLSKVIVATFFLQAYFRCDACLHGLAYMIRSGETPRSSMTFISACGGREKLMCIYGCD